jgi:hypothetical protein
LPVFLAATFLGEDFLAFLAGAFLAGAATTKRGRYHSSQPAEHTLSRCCGSSWSRSSRFGGDRLSSDLLNDGLLHSLLGDLHNSHYFSGENHTFLGDLAFLATLALAGAFLATLAFLGDAFLGAAF